jgi:hypothetical protein
VVALAVWVFTTMSDATVAAVDSRARRTSVARRRPGFVGLLAATSRARRQIRQAASEPLKCAGNARFVGGQCAAQNRDLPRNWQAVRNISRLW